MEEFGPLRGRASLAPPLDPSMSQSENLRLSVADPLFLRKDRRGRQPNPVCIFVLLKFYNILDTVIRHTTLHSMHYGKLKLALKFIQLTNISNLYSLKATQKYQFCQLCIVEKLDYLAYFSRMKMKKFDPERDGVLLGPP